MNVLLAVAATALVVAVTLHVLLGLFDHMDRVDADPVGRARLTLQERWLLADLERRFRHPARDPREPGRRDRPSAGPLTTPDPQ